MRVRGGAEGDLKDGGKATQTLHENNNLLLCNCVPKCAVSTVALFDLVHLFLQVHLSLNVMYSHL